MSVPAIEDLLVNIANRAIAGGAVQRCPKGTAAIARDYVIRNELVAAIPPALLEFQDWIDFHSNQLAASLQLLSEWRGGTWGHSRKLINLFLRDCTYNYLVRAYYDLQDIEKLLEVPLDSHVAKGIKADAKQLNLDWRSLTWPTLRRLEIAKSNEYQDAAQSIVGKDVARVHLDIKYWRSI